MSVQIIVDSSVDVAERFREKLRIVPLIIHFGEEELIDGVTINPGDYVFGDIDGTAVIPADLIDEVMDRAMEIESREDDVRDRLLKGASLTDTYMTIGAI